MQKYQVRVLRLGTDETELVRALRLIGRLDLKRAHDLAMHLKRVPGSLIVAGIDHNVADHIAETLRSTGATVDVQLSTLDSPMLCTPDANVIYEWGAMRTVRAKKTG
jgi:hypothetical protein